MGERENQPFQLSFNASLKIDFQGSRVTSDGGLMLVRELDERLGFGELITQYLTDSRRRRNTQLPLADLLRQSVSNGRGWIYNQHQARTAKWKSWIDCTIDAIGRTMLCPERC